MDGVEWVPCFQATFAGIGRHLYAPSILMSSLHCTWKWVSAPTQAWLSFPFGTNVGKICFAVCNHYDLLVIWPLRFQDNSRCVKKAAFTTADLWLSVDGGLWSIQIFGPCIIFFIYFAFCHHYSSLLSMVLWSSLAKCSPPCNVNVCYTDSFHWVWMMFTAQLSMDDGWTHNAFCWCIIQQRSQVAVAELCKFLGLLSVLCKPYLCTACGINTRAKYCIMYPVLTMLWILQWSFIDVLAPVVRVIPSTQLSYLYATA